MAGSPVRLSSGSRKRGTLVIWFFGLCFGITVCSTRGYSPIFSQKDHGTEHWVSCSGEKSDRDVSTEELRRALELNVSVCLGSTHPHKFGFLFLKTETKVGKFLGVTWSLEAK